MSSFGAASTGVDPQTGSYLSAEQRVAMFKGATGRSGFRGRSGGGGTGGGGGGGNPAVQPQNAIVVANKMTSVVQKLQTSYQQTTNSVASQVSQNRQTIENLSKVIAANREQELAEEKAETRLLREDKEAKLRADRESLIEGLASGAAGLASSVAQATQAVTKPLGGLLQRLLMALGSLAAAWAIDNFDTILGWAEDLKDRLDDLAGNFDKDLGDIRGVWSIFDLGLKRVMPFIRNLAARVGRIGRRIFDSAVDIGKKIFTKLKDFFTEIGSRIVRRLGDLWKAATGKVANVFKRPPKPSVPDSGAPKLPPGTDPDLDAPGKGPNVDPTDARPKGNWFTRRLDDLKGGLSKIGSGAKSMFDSGMEGLSKMKGSLQSALSSLSGGNAESAKPLGGAQKGFLSRILEGVARKAQLPKNLLNMLKSGMKNVDALFKRIPFVGFAIDAFLNHQAGVEFQENMIRSLSSAISGMVGAGAGAKIGGGIGFAAGSVVPVLGNAAGAAIGAALGAIIGGMLAGTAGDAVGAVAYESFTGKEATDTGALGSRTAIQGVRDVRDAIMGESGDSSETPKVTIPAATSFESGSTPEGLYNPDMKSAINMDFSEIELPAIDLRGKNFSPQSAEGADSLIEQIPDIMSFNPETSFYRDYSVLQYNLAG